MFEEISVGFDDGFTFLPLGSGFFVGGGFLLGHRRPFQDGFQPGLTFVHVLVGDAEAGEDFLKVVGDTISS